MHQASSGTYRFRVGAGLYGMQQALPDPGVGATTSSFVL